MALAVLVAVLALPAGPVVADSVWDVPVTPADPATYRDDPLWTTALADALAEQAADRLQLATSGAQREREASETAFEDASRGEATQLAQQTFPELLAAPIDDLGLPDGVHLDKFLAPDVARLTNSLGKHSLLIGSDPLAVPDDRGELAAIDLSLSAEQGKLVPENPAVEVALPDSAGDALQLPGKGIDIAADGAADVTGVVQDDRVFYPEVATDTDYITMPRADGAQVMWQLRSAQATEAPSLRLDLPDGAQARLTSMLTGALIGAAPAAEIVKDGVILTTIQAPVAKDADGTDVPAAYRLDGDTLIVDVAHREKDLHYPILVDPEIHEIWGGSDWDNYGKGACNCNMAGLWSLGTNGSGFAPYNATLAGRGLFIGSAPGFYYAGQSAQFTWGTPPYVSLMSAWFDGLYHVTQGDHLYAGTWGVGRWTSPVANIWGDDNYNGYTAIPDQPWENAQAVLGVWEDQTVQHPIWGWAGVRGVNIRIGDTRPPDVVQLDSLRVNGVPQPAMQGGQTSWINPAASVTARVYAHDLGLGLQHVGLMTSDNNWYGTGTLHTGCAGSRNAPCPPWSYADVTVPSATGTYNVRTVGIDITENATFGPAFKVRRDGQPPFIAFGGEVWDHRSDGTLGYNPTLQVVVSDGNPASATDHQSGYSRFSVTVDGTNITNYPNPNTGDCTDCAANQTVTLPITSPGAHTVQAYAVDKAGNASQTATYTLQVRNDTSWIYGGANHQIDTDVEAETIGNLLAGSGYQAAWNGLSTTDKNYMLTSSDDSHFSVWAPRIDTTASAAPDGIQPYSPKSSAHTVEIGWGEGDDPDISTGVFGTQVDETRSTYRYKRGAGSWTSWMSSDTDGFTLTSANAGDTIAVEARSYDRAGNLSASRTRTFQVPADTPVAHDSFFAIPVIACIEWCPVIAAGTYAGSRYFWEVNQNHYDWETHSADYDIRFTQSTTESQSFEDSEIQSKSSSRRRAFRNRAKAVAKEKRIDTADKEAHHAVAAGDRRAKYAREVLWRCGVDPTDFDANGIWLPKRYHRRMHTNDYYEAVNDMLRKYDTFGSDPCGQSQGGVDVDGKGLTRAMEDIMEYIRNGLMP
jgi:hypothetical protein